jgi:hypothetical protein
MIREARQAFAAGIFISQAEDTTAKNSRRRPGPSREPGDETFTHQFPIDAENVPSVYQVFLWRTPKIGHREKIS